MSLSRSISAMLRHLLVTRQLSGLPLPINAPSGGSTCDLVVADNKHKHTLEVDQLPINAPSGGSTYMHNVCTFRMCAASNAYTQQTHGERWGSIDCTGVVTKQAT